METGRKKYKRRRYLVDKNIQYRYIGTTLYYLAVFFIMTLGIIYFTAWREIMQKLSNVYPQARMVSILQVVYVRLLIGFLVLAPVAFVTALLASHKIAGPLVRIKKALRDIAAGDYNFKIKLNSSYSNKL